MFGLRNILKTNNGFIQGGFTANNTITHGKLDAKGNCVCCGVSANEIRERFKIISSGLPTAQQLAENISKTVRANG